MAGSWEWLASETLGSDGDTLSSGTFTAKKYLKVMIDIPSGGAASHITIRVGNGSVDAESNYAVRRSNNGATDTTGINQTELQALNAGNGDALYADINILNIANQEKLVIVDKVSWGASGAGTAPDRSEQVAKWTNTSAQINIIDLLNIGSGDMTAGAVITVWGADDAPLTYPSLPNGSVFITSDTNVHYMFDGTDTWNEVA